MALAERGGASAEIAERAGLDERYVREWLGGMAKAGICDYEPARRAFSLPAEHARAAHRQLRAKPRSARSDRGVLRQAPSEHRRMFP